MATCYFLRKVKAYRPGNKTPGRFDDAESDSEVKNDAREMPGVNKIEKLTPQKSENIGEILLIDFFLMFKAF